MDRHTAVYDCGFQVSLERLTLGNTTSMIGQTPGLLQKEPGSRYRVPSTLRSHAHRPRLLPHQSALVASRSILASLSGYWRITLFYRRGVRSPGDEAPVL